MADYRRMPPSSHVEHLQRSREEILGAVGEPPDLTFVRGSGNLGDELIWAGTRELLRGRTYTEIGFDELPGAIGHTALICGCGRFCQAYHELMPHVLAIAEMRFERVIVLPSTFDTSVGVIRNTLEHTRALVFAREQESYNQIQSLCDARLAHDCAFFFDYTPHMQDGSGVLLAFRTDRESAGERPIPPENDDISVTAGALERWLEEIANHELIQTDRAQVMIAGALLGKMVAFDASSYFKLPAIADYALNDFPVKRLPPATVKLTSTRLAPSPCSPQAQVVREDLREQAELNPPPPIERLHDSAGSPRVTAVIVSYNRPELILGALYSLIHVTSIPVNIVIVDNNSTPATRRALTEACAEQSQIRLHLSDRNLGASGGRQLGLELVETELVMFMDDDIELMPGALEHLVSELDLHPDVGGVTPVVVLADGRVSHSGGWYEESPEIVSFRGESAGVQFGHAEVPASGPCDWIQGTSLIRMSLLMDFPRDVGMAAYFEDTEWAFRVAKARPGCFRRSREALVIHHSEHRLWGRRDFVGLAYMAGRISASAHFYRAHCQLLRVPGMDVFSIMPQLTRTNETLDLVGARLVMELVNTHSTDWLLMEWMNGGLDPVLGVERTTLGDELHAVRTEIERLRAELTAVQSEAQDAQRQVEIERVGREEISARLRHIHESRLWKLGGSYDLARRRARGALASLKILPPSR